MSHCSEVPAPVFSSLPSLVSDDYLFEAMDKTDSDCSNCSDSRFTAVGSSQTTKARFLKGGPRPHLGAVLRGPRAQAFSGIATQVSRY